MQLRSCAKQQIVNETLVTCPTTLSMIASSISATTRSASPFSTEQTVFNDECPRLEDLEKNRLKS